MHAWGHCHFGWEYTRLLASFFQSTVQPSLAAGRPVPALPLPCSLSSPPLKVARQRHGGGGRRWVGEVHKGGGRWRCKVPGNGMACSRFKDAKDLR